MTFDRHVKSLASIIEELGNPFLEETADLLLHDTMVIASASIVQSVKDVQEVGKEALDSNVQEMLIERSKPLNDVIPRWKLPLFGSSSVKDQLIGKHKVALLKSDVQLYYRLYIACQTRDGNLDDFSSWKSVFHPIPVQGWKASTWYKERPFGLLRGTFTIKDTDVRGDMCHTWRGMYWSLPVYESCNCLCDVECSKY